MNKFIIIINISFIRIEIVIYVKKPNKQFTPISQNANKKNNATEWVCMHSRARVSDNKHYNNIQRCLSTNIVEHTQV